MNTQEEIVARNLYASKFGTEQITLQSVAFSGNTEFRVSERGIVKGYVNVANKTWNAIGTDKHVPLEVK